MVKQASLERLKGQNNTINRHGFKSRSPDRTPRKLDEDEKNFGYLWVKHPFPFKLRVNPILEKSRKVIS